MFHAVETSERFACERKVFEYEYLDIKCVRTETRKMRTVSVGFTFYSWGLNMEVFEYYKTFEHKISKGKYTRFFLWLASIAVGYFNRKVYLFSMRNLPLKNKYFLRFRQGGAHCWIF